MNFQTEKQKPYASIEYTWLYSQVMSFRGLKDGVEMSAFPSTLFTV